MRALLANLNGVKEQVEGMVRRKPPLKVWCSEELFGQERVIYIQHGESVYRLMKTRSGKLILNK